ncbi:uncharacterized protein LOC105201574 isoform X3 [Solenopsis invicta]|uniref:uncharacterized protein LOC105201574 isoform X3 n=1 Tax=Solenopsis invicta TaxID=13686 RepID=UPI00193D7598|nr:uncharacterized protein LOC105201574 isoform X3 [Solenopsis invicta]
MYRRSFMTEDRGPLVVITRERTKVDVENSAAAHRVSLGDIEGSVSSGTEKKEQAGSLLSADDEAGVHGSSPE